MLGMRKVKDANDAAREVMTIVNNLSPLDGLEMFAKTGAAFIETCGKLGITTDDLEKAMFNGIHMYRAEVRKQFNSPLRSPKDMAAFEAEVIEQKIQNDQINKALVEKHHKELHTACKDLKVEQLLEVAAEYKKVMEKFRNVAPGLFDQRMAAQRELFDREYSKFKRAQGN